MPTVPLIIPRIPQTPRVADGGGAYQGVSEASDRAFRVFNNLQESAARTEAARAVAEGGAELAGITQQNADSIVDPTEFAQKNATDIEAAYRSRIESARNPAARKLIEAGLADEMIKARYKTGHVAIGKTRDLRDADFIKAEDALRQKAVGGTPEELIEAGTAYGKLLGAEVAFGAMKPQEAEKKRIEFRDKINNDTMNLSAATQPVSFYERFNAGEFKNNDPVAVQRALDIAEKSQRARDEKVRRDTAWASREAERMYIAAAEKHQLDVNELEQAAEFYQWSDEKVDKIRQMQVGLRESNPNAQKLIADALDPITKPDPSMSDINRASQNLIGLSGKVSADSREYRAAMDKLRGLLRSTRIANDIQSNQAERKERKAVTDAKREVTQLLRKNEPRLRADRSRQKLNDWYDQLDGMSPDQARNFAEKVRKEYETKTPANVQRDLDRSEFKSFR